MHKTAKTIKVNLFEIAKRTTKEFIVNDKGIYFSNMLQKEIKRYSLCLNRKLQQKRR